MHSPDVIAAPDAQKEPAPPPAVYSVPEFCDAHRISISMLYKLWAERQGPDFFKVGARTLITVEAAARWRAAREKAAAA